MSKEKLLDYLQEKLVKENNTHTKHLAFLSVGAGLVALSLGGLVSSVSGAEQLTIASSFIAGVTGYQMMKANNKLSEDNELFNTMKEFKKMVKNSDKSPEFYYNLQTEINRRFVNFYEEDHVNSKNVKDYMQKVLLDEHIASSAFFQTPVNTQKALENIYSIREKSLGQDVTNTVKPT